MRGLSVEPGDAVLKHCVGRLGQESEADSASSAGAEEVREMQAGIEKNNHTLGFLSQGARPFPVRWLFNFQLSELIEIADVVGRFVLLRSQYQTDDAGGKIR
jgi:hypothetical protein